MVVVRVVVVRSISISIISYMLYLILLAVFACENWSKVSKQTQLMKESFFVIFHIFIFYTVQTSLYYHYQPFGLLTPHLPYPPPPPPHY